MVVREMVGASRKWLGVRGMVGVSGEWLGCQGIPLSGKWLGCHGNGRGSKGRERLGRQEAGNVLVLGRAGGGGGRRGSWQRKG